MNFLQIKIISNYAAIGLLIVLGLFFTHSELKQFNFDESTHLEHDYCKLVDDTTTRITKFSNQSLIQQQFFDGVNNSVIIHYINRPNGYLNNLDYETSTTQYHNDLYILKRSFLI